MQLSGAGPSFPHVKSGEFSKGVNPTVVPKCCIWRRSARPGPCCQRFSKMFAVTRTASAKKKNKKKPNQKALRVPIRSQLLSKNAQSSVATFHVTFPGAQLRDLRPGDTNDGSTRIKVLARHRRNQPKVSKEARYRSCPRKAGLRSSRRPMSRVWWQRSV